MHRPWQKVKSLKRLLLGYKAFSSCWRHLCNYIYIEMFPSAKLIIIKHSTARICTLASAKPHNSLLCKHWKCSVFPHSMGGKCSAVMRCPTAFPPPGLSGEAKLEAKYIFCRQFQLVAAGLVVGGADSPCTPTKDPGSWGFSDPPLLLLLEKCPAHLLLKHWTDTNQGREAVKNPVKCKWDTQIYLRLFWTHSVSQGCGLRGFSSCPHFS